MPEVVGAVKPIVYARDVPGAMSAPSAVRGPSQSAAVEVFGRDDIVGYRRSPSDVVRLILFDLSLASQHSRGCKTVSILTNCTYITAQKLRPLVRREVSCFARSAAEPTCDL